jgi:phosphatidate cytidylyltransferase
MATPSQESPSPRSGGAAVTGGGGRDLRVATLVGLGLLALLAVTFVTPPWTLTALIVGLIAVAGVEVARVLRSLGLGVHLDVLVGASVLMLVATHLDAYRGLAVGVVVLLLGSVLRSLAQRDRRDVVGTLGRTTLFGLWLGGLASFAILLRATESGAAAVLLVVIAAAAGDVFAYLVGSLAGRHRIAPSVSPNKTWEGLAGGVLAAAIAGAVLVPFAVAGAGWPLGALLGGLVALAAFVGDLAESLIKRDLGVKDLGSVLPGHGGVLDRVDGILFALPTGHLLLALLA